MLVKKKRIVAEDQLEPIEAPVDVEAPADEAPVDEEPVVNLDEVVTDLLFEAEDVAELIAEVTGEAVNVTADEDKVVFEVAGDEYTVEPEGDEAVLQAVKKVFRGKAPVKAATRRPVGRKYKK